ncbi:MAG: leucine--tRNA ligase [Chlamydiales bacterium]|nr:leucine--tRNA ligase [Chlamydiales bacterium]
MERSCFDHINIEKKWQHYWKENKTFKVDVDSSKPKYYILDMFPYPSGAGLHVGHVVGYTATDIVARYKRQKGFNVLHPMGWDSFGLPAEQYAIRTGTHPAITTKTNIDTYRRQLQSLGFSYDWDREVATSDASYYKWTQWIFSILYQQGLAYEAELLVNYCPALGTALSNEEIENGRSKDGGHLVERRPLRQWVLKITAYAERLLEDLDELDWPEGLKRLQRNWIGKSQGASITFKENITKAPIQVFTTRPDTLFGATYMVLAPEHPLLESIVSKEYKAAVTAYQKMCASKSDLERTELAKEKSGVFTGAYVKNVVTGRDMPIWISDYVLMSYGTGAIMAVPAHDERDFAFAKQYGLPIQPVIEPISEDLTKEDKMQILMGNLCWQKEGTLCNSASSEISLNGLDIDSAKTCMIRYLEEKGLGKYTVSYKLRDWLFSRQRYWGEPFPILHFEDGTKRVLDVDELPLCPPQVHDYKPSLDGKSPLSKETSWIELFDVKTGKKAFRESNVMPQWAGSCWYYLRFCDPHNENEAWSHVSEQYWMPVDLYVGGAEHAVLHLLYARFWHKVLFDTKCVTTKEPFKALRNQGLLISRSYQREGGAYVEPEDVIERDGKYYHKKTQEELRSQLEKMSKSKLNGITPDEIIEEFGADALRIYEMFMGPLEKEKIWNTDAVNGAKRFLTRFHDMAFSEKVRDSSSIAASKLGHRLIYGVSSDIEALQFNTAISKMMEFINEFTKLELYPKEIVLMATQVLAPFAPHLAEEIWHHFGKKESIAFVPIPEVDVNMLYDDTATYVVQVNGRLRGRFELPKNQSEEEILELAKKHPHISKYLTEEIKKVIFIPGKLLNLVI